MESCVGLQATQAKGCSVRCARGVGGGVVEAFRGRNDQRRA